MGRELVICGQFRSSLDYVSLYLARCMPQHNTACCNGRDAAAYSSGGLTDERVHYAFVDGHQSDYFAG